MKKKTVCIELNEEMYDFLQGWRFGGDLPDLKSACQDFLQNQIKEMVNNENNENIVFYEEDDAVKRLKFIAENILKENEVCLGLSERTEYLKPSINPIIHSFCRGGGVFHNVSFSYIEK